MVLDSEDRQIPVAEAFDAPVVEVHVRHLELGGICHRPLVTLDGEAVVLRRNQHSSGLDFLYRVVSTAMTVGHLGRRPAERQAEQLVSQANTESRYAARS